MSEPGAEIVPFGKYKGQPVQALVADQDYRDWLMSQPWFRERWGNVYQTVINYGAEPQDSPEHNQMQVAFLDDALCLRLARHLSPSLFDPQGIRYSSQDDIYYKTFAAHTEARRVPPAVTGRSFETGGWDVVFRVTPISFELKLDSLPDCICGPCDHSGCGNAARCKVGSEPQTREALAALGVTDRWCRHEDHPKSREKFDTWNCMAHCTEGCPWADRDAVRWLASKTHQWWAGSSDLFMLELKPDLGDDFPTVLRQVKNYDGGGYRCVVARRNQFERVTWEQVSEVFKASNIILVREADLAEAQQE